MKNINWKVVLGITFAMLIGVIVAPRESIWNIVFGIPLFICGGYWLYTLFMTK